jgi:glucose/arabinose dehydrogenase
MTFRTRFTMAALVAATGLALAHAETYVSEAIASVATGTPDADLQRLNAIVEALNADTSLKGSKLTVSPEGELVYLTGVTSTRAQMGRAVQIASSQAGDGKVANAITTEELKIVPAPNPATAMLEANPSGVAGEPPASASAASGEVIQPATPDGEKILPATPAK